MPYIPEWAIYALFAVAAFFSAKETKGVTKYVLCIIALVLTYGALASAITDPLFFLLVAIGVSVAAGVMVYKGRKKRRKAAREHAVQDALLRDRRRPRH